MRRPKSTTLVLVILVLGCIAALPFRRARDLQTAQATIAGPKVLPLRVAVPLQVSPLVKTSLAAELVETERASATLVTRPEIRIDDQLDGDAAPPALATHYRTRMSSATEADGGHVETEDAQGVHFPEGSSPRRHRVRDGDTLRLIAKKYLGSEDRYLELFAANRPHILQNVDLLPLGEEIVIPPR